MIEGRWLKPGADLAEALSIREIVLGTGRDALDDNAWNAVVYQEGRAVGTGRIWWSEGVYWLGDMCVLPECRRHMLGDLLARLLIYKAQTHGARRVAVKCRPEQEDYYAAFGFAPQPDGTLRADAASICLDSCEGCKHPCGRKTD